MSEPVHLSPPMSQDVPKLIIFDLDDTVWYPELYMMCGAPWTRDELGRVTDVCDEELSIYPAAREAIAMILRHEAFAGTRVAVASRTNRGRWALRPWISCPSPPGCPPRPRETSARYASGASGDTFRRSAAKQRRLSPHMPSTTKESTEEVGQLGVCCVHCPGGMSQGA